MIVRYEVLISDSAKRDIKAIKKYILDTFGYRELAEDFSKKIKRMIKSLEVFPNGHQSTGLWYRAYNIYLMPRSTYLFFYIVNEDLRMVTIVRVMHDGMDWQNIIKQLL
ncbi:MAG: type II toxin-antitoxin system RelE/ParE family toxin [Lachnospiraceae bacterium]|nr:type II toxin-antitoxin system RelE/ParE family toxin [Lachnospiraceae bacterium]